MFQVSEQGIYCNLLKNSQAFFKRCVPIQKDQGEKSCEIQVVANKINSHGRSEAINLNSKNSCR